MVNIILPVSYCQYHIVKIILSRSYGQYHIVNITLSISYCQYYIVNIILSISYGQYYIVNIILSISYCQYHIAIIILPLSYCQYHIANTIYHIKEGILLWRSSVYDMLSYWQHILRNSVPQLLGEMIPIGLCSSCQYDINIILTISHCQYHIDNIILPISYNII